MGVCGRAVSGLAIELASLGWRVSGSDFRRFEPVASALERVGVTLIEQRERVPFGAEMVIISGAASASHPQVMQAGERGIPVQSFAAFLGDCFLTHSVNLVVAGTNGKTTTSAMLLWILRQLGADPDFLIGGEIAGIKESVRFRGAGFAVMEGDEYPADLIGCEPKFLYYRPRLVGLTNIHHDHPEIYGNVKAYEQAFHRLIRLLPPDGRVIYNADDPAASRIASHHPLRTGVGFSEFAERRLSALTVLPETTNFFLDGRRVALPAHTGGEMNARNAALAIAMAEGAGFSLEESAEALTNFPGVHERQEVINDTGGATLLIDEAYHPDALRLLFAGLSERFPGRRLLPVFRARYHGGANGYHQLHLVEAFRGIKCAVVCSAVESGDGVPFDNERLSRELREAGCEVTFAVQINDVPAATESAVRRGDVVICLFGFGKPNLRLQLAEIVEGIPG